MKRNEISKPNKALLKTASRQFVEECVIRIPERQKSVRWIRLSNRYRLHCTTKYDKDIDASTVNDQHLSEYICQSASTHVIDGWSFLGRAVEAALRGDTYSSVHFAYYCELRAAMGLLAGEGIGLFNQGHPILKSTGNTVRYPVSARPRRLSKVGTHKAIWPMLSYWSSLPRAADLLDELISPMSVRLSHWLAGTGAHAPVKAVAKSWLRAWGIDLAAVDDDHDSRNLSSYRPSQFRKPAAIDVHDVVSFVEDLWQLFEPQGSQRFPNLQRILLRTARNQATSAPATTQDLERLGLTPLEATDWANFLTSTANPIPVEEAQMQSEIDSPRCHLQIISRGALLLFVATAAARRLLVNAAYSADNLSFWWDALGEERGLWGIGGAPPNPLDLWADVHTAISDSSRWRANNPRGSVSLRDWRSADILERDYLGAFEMVGIWGLLP